MLNSGAPVQEDYIDPLKRKYAGQYLKKRALVDPQLVKNQVREFSHAERKTLFRGDHGAYDSSHLQAWFQVWDQTQVDKIKALD